MLGDQTLQLLTGYVDGELNGRQRRAVARLLNESSEARAMLRQLQENAHKIRQLPRRKLDPGFAADVVKIIVERTGKRAGAARPVPLRWLPYAAVGAAAAVLFVAALGGALYLALRGDGLGMADLGNGVAKNDGPPAVQPDAVKRLPPEPEPMPPPRKPPNPLIAQVTEGVYQQYAAVIPPERNVTVTFAEIKNEGEAARQLVSEINKNEAIELDVTVHDNPLALDRLKTVLRSHGVKLVVAPGSNAMLKKNPRKGEFLVYAENFSRVELAKMLRQLAVEEKKNASAFHKVAVASLSQRDHQLVASLFGQDPTKRDPPRDKGIKQKIPKGPRKKVERVAVVLPQAPEASASDEVRQFLLQAARPQPGSVRVLLRIRQK